MGQVVMNLFSRNPNNSNTEQPLETSKNNSANEEDIDKNITIENVKNETNPKYEDEHPKIENITIGVNFTIDILYLKPPSDEENSESLSKLSKLYYKERIKQEDTKARNDLENAIFETEKTITLGEIKHYFTEEEYNNMISVTQHTKEWFEIEGYSQNSTICKLRLSDIKSALSPGLTRIKDRQETERDTHNLLELINKTQQLVINTYERSELQQILNQTQGLQLLTMSYNTQKWLSDKLEEQKLLLPTDKPVLTSSQIRKKIKELDQSGESYYKTVQDTLNILANLMKTKTASNADLNKTKTNEISDNSTTEDNSKETAKNITQEDLKTEL
uniref:Hypoxia up-regulated protein 1 n=1 Tax=Henneguya salminicola TaxID=69463 RepID=A0A6G3MFY8_HENSL